MECGSRVAERLDGRFEVFTDSWCNTVRERLPLLLLSASVAAEADTKEAHAEPVQGKVVGGLGAPSGNPLTNLVVPLQLLGVKPTEGWPARLPTEPAAQALPTGRLSTGPGAEAAKKADRSSADSARRRLAASNASPSPRGACKQAALAESIAVLKRDRVSNRSKTRRRFVFDKSRMFINNGGEAV